jgi:hypothetical protein
MRPPKYPLEPLARLRAQKVDEAARVLAGAVTTRETAERVRLGAEQRRASQEEEAKGVRDVEAEELLRGDLRVADLARAGAWEVRVASEQEKLALALTRAREEEGKAREGEKEARESVAAKRADAEVVEKDAARWREGVRKRAETKEEDAASEAWRRKQ